MAIQLGGIQLNKVHRLVTLEQANFVLHKVPGKEGNIVQDLGRNSVQLEISGIFYGDNSREDLEAMRKLYKKREPVDFIAEIIGQAYFSQVTIERLEVFQLSQEPEQFSYTLGIAEYVPPTTPTAAAISNVDTAIETEAMNLMDVANLPDALQLGLLPEITNPIEPLKGVLEPIKEATKNLDEVTQGLKAILGI
jgi:hypothetical protein